MATEIAGTKTKAQPISCPKGHQLYVMFFPEHNKFGFGCGSCKSFSLGMEYNGGVLEINFVNPALAVSNGN